MGYCMDKSLELLKSSAVGGANEHNIYVYTLDRVCLRAGDTAISDDNTRSLKQWSVLCYLILHRDRSVSQAELIDNFWPEEDNRNPLSALKVLILRIRNLLEPLCENPILSQRGAYQWNPAIPCAVDAEIFEKLCQLAAHPDTPLDRRLELYREAISLYKGDLLPKQNGQQWVIPLTSRYRNCYSSAVKEYAALLQEAGLYEKMGQVALSACNLLPLDEQLHILVIRSYILQKKNADALEHYKKATKALYQTLGLPPSAELQAVYAEILSEEKDIEINLDTILSAMLPSAKHSGAFFCEYGIFRSVYQLEGRRISRSGGCLHIALMTLTLSSETARKFSDLNTIMDLLQTEILSDLRQGDVVSRYSKSQFVIMLPGASLEDSGKVMDRIISSFYSKFPRTFFEISYTLRGLEPSL